MHARTRGHSTDPIVQPNDSAIQPLLRDTKVDKHMEATPRRLCMDEAAVLKTSKQVKEENAKRKAGNEGKTIHQRREQQTKNG